MPSIVLPSAETFRRAGWIASNQQALLGYIDTLTKNAKKRRSAGEKLLSKVQAFKDFIETDPVVYTEFIRMFENAKETDNPKNYHELIYLFDEVFRQSPQFGTLGPPLYMVMAQNMNTQGGFSAYTKEVLNKHFKEMFVTWVRFLETKDSLYVLNKDEHGWLSQAAIDTMLAQYPNRTFEQVFISKPNEPYYGFTSFEEFFNRRYANVKVDRPTQDLNDLRLISLPCEANFYAHLTNVQRSDELFIKSEAYSLVHLLANDPYTDEFVGGQIYQGFLNTPGYHRWHSPINGTIKKIVDVPGTYFAQAPSTIGEPIPLAQSNSLPPYLQSLVYFANTATRQLIFIDSDNPVLGLVCFIAIGMTEISSCEATVYEGQHVVRGDQLGMFHFGGSSFAILFRANANVKIGQEYTVPDVAIRINEPFATVDIPK